MLFFLEGVAGPDVPRPYAVLRHDSWNDWFVYKTLYFITIVDADGRAHDLGAIKIGQVGLTGSRTSPDYAVPAVPEQFAQLDETFFSVGTAENYYETLIELGDEMRDQVLTALRDVAYDLKHFERTKNEDSMTSSLLRYVAEATVTGRFKSLASGNPKLTAFKFTYKMLPHASGQSASTLEFEVAPERQPPTNAHVLIGRNGVGKSTCFYNMAMEFVAQRDEVARQQSGQLPRKRESYGEFEFLDATSELVSCVFVSFSAFDRSPPTVDDESRKVFHYVGLQTVDRDKSGKVTTRRLKTGRELADDFLDAVVACRAGARRGRWREALGTLESDPLFREQGLAALTEDDDVDAALARAEEIYEKLSSGHKVVLLTISKLVQYVDENTLVLIDEPEAHLHPPLLSAFVRSLSDLLISRNGVAFIATHSPVVLQEVPSECVSILSRFGQNVAISRPRVETFGENVGVLTREVFGLEVTESGFHAMLEKAVGEGQTYEEVVKHFKEKLGTEARAIVRALIAAEEGEGF